MIFRRSSIPFLAFATFTAAGSPPLTPPPSPTFPDVLEGVPPLLAQREHHLEVPEANLLGKRVTGFSDVLCGLGIASSCPPVTSFSVSDDTQNCGAVGNICPTSYVNGAGTVTCSDGNCVSACVSGYTFSIAAQGCIPQVGATINTQSDPSNCGTIGNVCNVTTDATGTACSNGVCVVTGCNSGFSPSSDGTTCSTAPAPGASASQRAKAKKNLIVLPATLCPDSETACPIAGSKSHLAAKVSNFRSFRMLDPRQPTSGGYECLDLKYSLESCGGCTSMGEGVNCMEIDHAVGVGCAEGVCIVFSCERGYKPNADNSGCERKSLSKIARLRHAKRHKAKQRHHH
ncbi:tenascin XB [Pseudohyphozyma bogoriensis]|nr:tenascin XB [Pseudohyphozyma bogoriensis]